MPVILPRSSTPEIGSHGNIHFAFSDLNSLQVADLLSTYLHENRLAKR